MATQETTRRRIAWLQNFLTKNPGDTKPLAELSKELAKATKTPNLSVGQLGRVLRKMSSPVPGGHLTVGRGTVRLDIVSDYVLDMRRQLRPKTKEQLASAVWTLLLGAPLPRHLRLEPAEEDSAIVSSGWTESLRERLREVRRSTSVAIFVDAGSTTETAFRQLDAFPSLSFTNEQSRGRRSEMTPRLQVITSSLAIANALCRSPHRYDLQTIVVGGQVRPEYESICGQITQNLLTHFAVVGGIALIGATGFRPAELRGGPCFLCNSLDESFIKSSFLKMADLRVVVIDSEKVANPAPHRNFASLSDIDLVIIDSGREETEIKGLSDLVSQFCAEAHRRGVATALISRRDTK